MKKTFAVVIFAALGLTAAIADTHEDREALMKQNGGALKTLGAAGQAMPFDPAAAKAPSQTLIDNAGKIPALFAPGTENADPAALPGIWTDAAGFAAAADKMGADARTLQGATDATSYAVALKTVQGDCGSCHGTYRAKPAPRPAPAQ